MTQTQDFPGGGAHADIPASPPETFRKTAWGMIWLLTLTVLASATISGLLSPLQEAARLDLGLTDVQIGLALGLAVAAPVAILSLPLAYLVDHTNRIRLLIGLALLWSLSTICTAFVSNLAGLIAVRTLTGVAAGCVIPVIISLMADVSMPEKRGRALVVVSIGFWAGAAAAFAVGGGLYGYLTSHSNLTLLKLAPWRETHLIVGLVSLILSAPLFFLREPARFEVENAKANVATTLRALWSRRAFLGPLFVGQFSGGMAEGAAGVWVATILIRQYHQSPGAFGGWMGLVILGSGILGSLIGGFASDAGQKLKIRGGILLVATVGTFISIPAGAYSIMPTVSGFAWVLFALLLGGTVVNLNVSASIAVLVPNEERALCLTVLKSVGTVVGLGVAPPLVAWLGHQIGGPAGLGQAMAIFSVAVAMVSLVGFVVAMMNAPRTIAFAGDVPATAG
jgi:MFS family permease